MTKDEEGVWSITVGPLVPTTYIYSFNVDGIAMADPVNPKIKLRARGSGSLVDVPGASAAIWDFRDVPHGEVNINWHKSKVQDGALRSVWVYTPPGYDKDRKQKYPVLYLLHGSNDTPAGWTTVGNANFILDNMIAEKTIQPMIVVMPFGHAVPFGERGANNNAVFEKYLIEEVMPYMESEYRIAAAQKTRAIAGLSMGGDHSILIGFNHLDLFSAIGAFSPVGPRDFETRFPAILADAKGTNAKLRTVYMACGRQDPGHFTSSERFSGVLTKHGIKHTYRATEGAHNFALWRQYLVEFLPQVFR